MTDPANARFTAQKDENYKWNVIDMQTGEVANLGGCLLRNLDAKMAHGLLEDLNSSHPPLDRQPSTLATTTETTVGGQVSE